MRQYPWPRQTAPWEQDPEHAMQDAPFTYLDEEPLTVTQIRRIAQAVNGGKARGGIIRLATLMRVSRQAIDFWLARKHLPSPRLDRLLRQVANDHQVDLDLA